jgi:ABC-type dipeptide/oligopeptide/nickel transport system permease subunit
MTDVAHPGVAPRARRLLPRSPVPPSVAAAALVLTGVVACALVPGLFAPASPTTIDPTTGLQAPSAAHVLGTDQLGRDVLSRVIFGARSALVGPLIVATATLVLSTALSLLAGYCGGLTDAVVSRSVDLLYSLPPLIVAIVLVGVFGGGYWMAIGVLIVLNVPHNVRILRAAVIERRHLPYVEAAETLGAPPLRIMTRHLLPNIAPVVAVCFFLRFTYGLVDLSALSFLGLGVPPGSTDWGRMLAENRVLIFQNAWAAVAPGAALVITAVSANFVGDWLYEHFERRGRAR